MTKISNPLALPCGVIAKNRLFKSAMSEQLGDAEQNPTDKLFRLYQTWAQGGIGICVSGNIMVDRNALGEPKNVVLDEQSNLDLFRRWASVSSQNGTEFWAQLNHPGKQIPNFLNKQPVAPSAVPLGSGLEKAFNCPRELTDTEIETIVEQFATSAKLAKQAGFTGVQIHSAHGYLVNQFLSPHHNRRKDRWGGPLENRMRFLIEIYRSIRDQVGSDFPVAIKLNSADFQKGGFSEDDFLIVVQELDKLGVDLIEVSGGNYENPEMMGKETTAQREAFFIEQASKAKALLKTSTLAVTGGFRSARAMNQALGDEVVDAIGIARPLAVYPDLPNKLMADDNYSIRMKPLSTGSKVLDRMSMLELVWYEHQMERIGSGKPAKPNQSSWYSVLRNFKDIGSYAWKKRRA